jgi:hypothetical protein
VGSTIFFYIEWNIEKTRKESLTVQQNTGIAGAGGEIIELV